MTRKPYIGPSDAQANAEALARRDTAQADEVIPKSVRTRRHILSENCWCKPTVEIVAPSVRQRAKKADTA